MKKAFSLLERVPRSDSTILILGESGTGKERGYYNPLSEQAKRQAAD